MQECNEEIWRLLNGHFVHWNFSDHILLNHNEDLENKVQFKDLQKL
jgi:hypothetical protein